MKELTVSKNIQNSDNNRFRTVQEAIDSLPRNNEPAKIYIEAGIYREKITLTRGNTVLEGLGSTPSDTILVYGDFAFDSMPDASKRGTFRSYSFFLDAADVTLKNLTISNDSGDEKIKGQAIALYAEGERLLVENCRLTGRQDTLFTGPLPPKEIQPGGFIGPKQFSDRINTHQHYLNCYICGNVDFIFGSATALFENCTIESLAHDSSSVIQGYVTAPSAPEGQKYGYVFKNCSFTSSECPSESVYLGRPWRDYAKAVFINCKLGRHICAEGFHDWGKPSAHSGSYFAVGNCLNACNESFVPSADFSHLLSSDEISDYLNNNDILTS